jgi:predicted amidohydrolase YtcJ
VIGGGSLLIRNIAVGRHRRLDVRIEDGRIAEIGRKLKRRAPVLDGSGGALLPGLHDHHIHLLALGAQSRSVSVGPEAVGDEAAFESALRRAVGNAGSDGWVRATGYHEGVAGPLDRDRLDRIVSDRPLRLQYRTGSLWVLNSVALNRVLPSGPTPPCVERDDTGRPTGRIWRGDDWLRSRFPATPPDLAGVGARLAAMGFTGVTDASATTGPAEAALLADAARRGDLPQRLTLMSARALAAPDDRAYRVGPVKILLDEHELPDFAEVVASIAQARHWRRPVAFHCVTAVELAFVLAVFETAGARPGDRIEHGGVIHDDAAQIIARLGVTVVTQPSFIAQRGDAYRVEVDRVDQPALYRAAGLLRFGVLLAGSTDAPYAAPDPWAAIAAAVHRRTRQGMVLGATERLSARAALSLFLGSAVDPGGWPRRVAVGMPADLCLLDRPLNEALSAPQAGHVAATLIGGQVVHRTEAIPAAA